MEDVLLQVQNLTFAYRESAVLKDINVTIHRGEKIAVMGANGAGKSTFFLHLNGVLHQDEGTICLAGRQIQKKTETKLRQKVGYVFQDADSQLIASNVRAEISFGPMNLGLSQKEVKKRVEEALNYMDLEDLAERPPHYLSGGEKKRVSIADILAMEPEILLFDEPMAALDPFNASRVEQILWNLHEEGKTLLIATHDVDFAYRFADRIIVFAEGSILADGDPFDLFHNTDMMEQAHLKAPAMMTVWEALRTANLVTQSLPYPTTLSQVVEAVKAMEAMEERGL
ncbi:MAG: ABC transporter ATP-binding protein [Lachnospiraceae bacterium]